MRLLNFPFCENYLLYNVIYVLYGGRMIYSACNSFCPYFINNLSFRETWMRIIKMFHIFSMTLTSWTFFVLFFCIFFIEIELLNHKFGDICWSSFNCLKYHKTSTKNTEWSKQFNYIMVFWIRPFLWLWLAKFEITKFWIVNHVHFLFLWSSLHYYSLCLYLSFKETNNAKCFSR